MLGDLHLKKMNGVELRFLPPLHQLQPIPEKNTSSLNLLPDVWWYWNGVRMLM